MSTPTENAPSLDELADLTTKPQVPELYAETDNSEGFMSDYTHDEASDYEDTSYSDLGFTISMSDSRASLIGGANIEELSSPSLDATDKVQEKLHHKRSHSMTCPALSLYRLI